MQENYPKQHYQNCVAFIIIYTLIGIMVGLIFDILITYLMAVSPDAAKGIASYMGIAAFIASALAALVPKLGYKKIMVSAPIMITLSLILIAYSGNNALISIALIFLLTGTTVYDVMLPPYIATYTKTVERASFFTKTIYANVVGVILGTLVGGPLIVWVFSKKLSISYYQAKLLTSRISSLDFEQLFYYIASYRTVLLGFALISILMLIPILSVKESCEDYKIEPKSENSKFSSLSPLMSRYVILFLVYIVLSRFAASLIAPNVSAFLTGIGINRASISMLGMLQYLSILILMPFSNRIAGKLGQVNTVVIIFLVTVPFMIILANGYNYSSNVELIVGSALFFRAGLANTTVPVITSLSMELVSKSHRSLYSSLIFVTQGLAQISAGVFTKYYLFNTSHGYANAYYYAAGLYIVAHVMLFTIFAKKYNKAQDLQC